MLKIPTKVCVLIQYLLPFSPSAQNPNESSGCGLEEEASQCECSFEKASNRRVTDGLCGACKSHLTGEKPAQKENSTFSCQNKSLQPSYILCNVMAMFSFSSSAKKHQVFGTLKEAVKLNLCSLNFFTKQTREEESNQEPGLALGS